MKNYLLFIGTFLSMGLVSCEYFEIEEEPKQIEEVNSIPPGITVNENNGILEFNSMADLNSVLADLESQVDVHNDNWLTSNPGLTWEQLDDLEISTGFDHEKPLTDFENLYPNFNSLRSNIIIAEENFLNNDDPDLDFSLDPDNHFVCSSEERAILNVNLEVKIGSIYYKILSSGSWYEIADYATLQGVNNGTIDPYNSSNVIVVNGESITEFSNKRSSTCSSGKFTAGSERNTSRDKCIRYTIAHQTYPWDRYVRATTKNRARRRNNNGNGIRRWRNTRYPTETMVFGYISGNSGDCSTQTPFNPSNDKEAETRVKVSHKIDVLTRTKSGWVEGDHKGIGSLTKASKLEW